jgi:hypothetical protein
MRVLGVTSFGKGLHALGGGGVLDQVNDEIGEPLGAHL